MKLLKEYFLLGLIVGIILSTLVIIFDSYTSYNEYRWQKTLWAMVITKTEVKSENPELVRLEKVIESFLDSPQSAFDYVKVNKQIKNDFDDEHSLFFQNNWQKLSALRQGEEKTAFQYEFRWTDHLFSITLIYLIFSFCLAANWQFRSIELMGELFYEHLWKKIYFYPILIIFFPFFLLYLAAPISIIMFHFSYFMILAIFTPKRANR